MRRELQRPSGSSWQQMPPGPPAMGTVGLGQRGKLLLRLKPPGRASRAALQRRPARAQRTATRSIRRVSAVRPASSVDGGLNACGLAAEPCMPVSSTSSTGQSAATGHIATQPGPSPALPAILHYCTSSAAGPWFAQKKIPEQTKTLCNIAVSRVASQGKGLRGLSVSRFLPSSEEGCHYAAAVRPQSLASIDPIRRLPSRTPTRKVSHTAVASALA